MNVFDDLGMEHAEELRAAADRSRSPEQFKTAARTIRGLHQMWDHVLSERIPDKIMDLVEKLVDDDREVLRRLK